MKYCLITDRRLYSQSLAKVAEAAEAANVDYFQLREKDLSPRDLLALAKEVRPSLHKTVFIVNGSLEVALASKADGVHLQHGNIPVEAVRSRFSHLTIGYSAHSEEEMRKAEECGANYVFISPVFETISKTSTLLPLETELTARWCHSLRIPAFALGGITAERLALLKSAGIHAVAGISLFVSKGKFTDQGMVA